METRTDDDVVSVILHQHEEVRHLLQAIGGAPVNGRAEEFKALVRLLTAHEKAEQTVVYPALQAMGGEGPGIAKARMAEEAAAEDVIAKMQAMDPASAQFAQAFIAFRGDVESHASHEESEVLPLLAHLKDDEAQQMAEAFRAAAPMS